MRKISLIALLLSVLFFSCATLEQLIQKPTVELVGMSLRDMSLFDGTMVFKFKVTNPNPMGATLSNLSYNLKIDNNEFIKGVQDKGIRLPAGGWEIVELPLTVNYLEFFDSVTEFINNDEIPYDLSGSFGIMGFNIPYHTKGKLSIPKLPKVSLKSVDISGFSFLGASLNFVLELDNSNPFAVALNGLDYGIKLGGTEFVNGEAKTITNIAQNGKSTIKIPLNVNFLKLGQSAYNLLTGDSSEYELTGNMKFNVPKIGEKSFPFSKLGEVPFTK